MRESVRENIRIEEAEMFGRRHERPTRAHQARGQRRRIRRRDGHDAVRRQPVGKPAQHVDRIFDMLDHVPGGDDIEVADIVRQAGGGIGDEQAVCQIGLKALCCLDRGRGNVRAIGLEPRLGEPQEVTGGAAEIQEAPGAHAAGNRHEGQATALLAGIGFIVAVFLLAEILRAVHFGQFLRRWHIDDLAVTADGAGREAIAADMHVPRCFTGTADAAGGRGSHWQFTHISRPARSGWHPLKRDRRRRRID